MTTLVSWATRWALPLRSARCWWKRPSPSDQSECLLAISLADRRQLQGFVDRARDAAVQVYIDNVTPARRRRDAETLLRLLARLTGEAPRMWGSIVGFGDYHYHYESGRQGDAPAAGFAARKAATTIYLPDGVGAYDELLAGLGPHTTGVGCLYLKDLETNDLAVLECILARSFKAMSDGTYKKRAREGGSGD